jgi:hypothetical protein
LITVRADGTGEVVEATLNPDNSVTFGRAISLGVGDTLCLRFGKSGASGQGGT